MRAIAKGGRGVVAGIGGGVVQQSWGRGIRRGGIRERHAGRRLSVRSARCSAATHPGTWAAGRRACRSERRLPVAGPPGGLAGDGAPTAR